MDLNRPAQTSENSEGVPMNEDAELAETELVEKEAADGDSGEVYIILSDDESEKEYVENAPEIEDETPETESKTAEAEDETPKEEDETPKAADETPKEENKTPKTENETPKTGDETPKAEDDAEFEHDAEDEETELEREKVEEGFFADDLEMLELTLPDQSAIKEGALKLWNSRKLTACSVPVEETQKSILADLLSGTNCTQIAFRIERGGLEHAQWAGSLDVVFDSKTKMNEFIQQLKSIESDIKILNAANSSEWDELSRSRSVHFLPQELEKWPHCLVCVKYLPPNISEDKLREIFPDAFDVMLFTSERPNLTEAQRLTGFLFYGCAEAAEKFLQAYSEQKTSVDGVRLAFFKYDAIVHPSQIGPALLTPSERYLILKERKVVEKLTQGRGAQCASFIDKFNSKIKEDDKIRKSYGLPILSLEELRTTRNLKVVRAMDAFKIVRQKGLLWRNRYKVLTGRPVAAKPLASSANKGLRSGVTNPNKRKRKRIAQDSKPRPGMPSSKVPPLFQARGPPPLKAMRFAARPAYMPYNGASYEMEGNQYDEMAFQPEQMHPVPRRQAPALMPRPRMAMSRPEPRMQNAPPGRQLLSRLLTMAHSNTGPLMGATPRPRMPARILGNGQSRPVGRPALMGLRNPGPGMPMMRGPRGDVRGPPRPLGKGWPNQGSRFPRFPPEQKSLNATPRYRARFMSGY